MTEKEQLEKKLKFLKGSFESGIISEEEYKQRKEKIEEKLKDLVKEKPEELKEKKEEIKIQEIKEDKLKEIEEKEIKKKEPIEPPKEEEIKEEVKKPSKKKKNKLIIFFVIILIIFLAFYFNPFKETNKEKKEIVSLKPECVVDDDCKMEGKFGICQNPNTKEAICVFKDIIEVNLTIINDENCDSCDTSRMQKIIKKFFPGVKINEIHHTSTEGRTLLDKFNVDVLPAYIFEEKLAETFNFFKMERMFTKKDNNYLMLPTATGANYFFRRKEIPYRLDLFVLVDDPDKNDKNVAEVIALFGDKIAFEKHIIKDEDKIKNELIITTYPTFLVNNKLKFTGVQSPELIKTKFCELNKLLECETKLSEIIK